MKSLISKRFIFQQQPQNPEQQQVQAPPATETGNETPLLNPETAKEAPPASPETVSTEYKDKAQKQISGATAKLDIFQNLKVG